MIKVHETQKSRPATDVSSVAERLVVVWPFDIQAIDFCNWNAVLLLVVRNPLTEVLPGFVWVSMIAAAIAAGFAVLLGEL